MFLCFTCFACFTCFVDGTQNFLHRENLIQRLIIGFHRIFFFSFLFCETQFQSCQDIQALSCFLFSYLSKRFSICNFSSVAVIFLSSFPVFPPWISSVLRLPSVPQSAAASLELHITHVSLFSLDGPISKASHKFLPSLMFLPRPSSVLSFACLVSAWSPHKHDIQLIFTL